MYPILGNGYKVAMLALRILAGEFDEGDTVIVDRGPNGLTFSVTVPVVDGQVVG